MFGIVNAEKYNFVLNSTKITTKTKTLSLPHNWTTTKTSIQAEQRQQNKVVSKIYMKLGENNSK